MKAGTAWLEVAPGVRIAAREVRLRFKAAAAGPGGQNVNRVATAVELRFDLRATPSLDPGTKARAAVLAGRRLGQDGVLTLVAQRFRTQAANRRDAIARLVALLGEAVPEPDERRPTRPSRAARARRREAKRHRGQVKALRRPADEG